MCDLFLAERFKKELRKILRKDPRLEGKVRKQLKLLIVDFRYKSLRIHKLSGQNNYSLSVNMSIRIIFSVRGKKIFCLRIGTHDEIY